MGGGEGDVAEVTSISDQVRGRIAALLDLEHKRAGAVDGTPRPPADEVGAAAALAYRWPDEAALVTVYAFTDYDALLSAQEKLRQTAQGQTVEMTSNGGLLLWATAPQGDPTAEARIKYMASDFAGEE